jgi:hypothetical protein
MEEEALREGMEDPRVEQDRTTEVALREEMEDPWVEVQDQREETMVLRAKVPAAMQGVIRKLRA